MKRFLLALVVCAFAGAGGLWAQTPVPESSSAQGGSGERSIVVDLGSRRGPLRAAYSWFGYDEGNYTTRPHGRKLLGELHDLSPVPVHLRVHHLLTSGDGTPELKWSSTGVYREDASGRPLYDFAILDGIFDAFRATGVQPMVELGFMPEDLAAVLPDRHEPYQVHFPRSTIAGASNNPPKDYARWGELVRVVTAHLVARYGAETVREWPFEVWNEPDIDYWHGSAEEYWRLYDYAVAGVRAALPGAIVGGPATTSPRNAHAAAYLEGFLTHVESGRSAADGGVVPLDFVSFHVKGQPKIEAGRVTMGLQSELMDADQGFALVARHPRFRGLPIILSEADPEGCAACSSRMNPANNYRNGTLYPAYTAAAYKGLLDLAADHGVNIEAMLSWSFEFEDREYFEGFRDLSTNGIDKPILNLFRMLGTMQGERVATTSTGQVALEDLLRSGVRAQPDVDAMAALDGRQASVLVWNYQDAAETAAGAPVRVEITGVPTGVRRALVTQFRIDDAHSNAYAVWKAMGSPQQPTAEQIAVLKARDGLEMFASPAWVDVGDGRVVVRMSLPGESVSLLQVRWE